MEKTIALSTSLQPEDAVAALSGALDAEGRDVERLGSTVSARLGSTLAYRFLGAAFTAPGHLPMNVVAEVVVNEETDGSSVVLKMTSREGWNLYEAPSHRTAMENRMNQLAEDLSLLLAS